MSDPKRLPHIVSAAETLPKGAALIYRHFGAANKLAVAKRLATIMKARGGQLLVGGDIELAAAVGAHGVHLPERHIGQAEQARAQYPNWIISAAIHSAQAIERCGPWLDAAILSPVFASRSPSAGAALGVGGFAKLAAGACVPAFALGGINAGNADQLIGSGTAGLAGICGFTKVRTLGVSAAPAMAALHEQGFDRPWPAADLGAHIKAATDDVLGCFSGGALAGFIITRTADDQAEILTIIVGKDARGAGHGFALLCAGEDAARARGADIMFLDVARDNAAAIALYKRAGYHQCGVRAGYYRRAGGRVDAILLQKRLAAI
jgi:thiamine-phosphate pyrophosphorylase